MPTLPIYALTIFEEDDSTPLFTVSTDPVATYPYLKAFDNFPEQEIDFAKSSASIGQQNVQIVDVPQTPGDQTTGFLTGLLATAAGYSALNGHRALATQDIGAGAEVILDGVVRSVSLLDTYSSYQLELRDIRERERKCRAFATTDTPTVLPRGVLAGYGGGLLPGTRPLKARYFEMAANEGVFVLLRPTEDLPEVVLTAAQRDALSSVAPVPGALWTYIYDRWKVLWRETGTADPWTVVEQVAHMHPDLTILTGLPLLREDPLGVSEFRVNNAVSGDTLPADQDLVDFIVQYDGPVTQDWAHHIDGISVGELLVEGYDGDHSATVPRIRYDSTAVLALTTPVRGRIKEPVDDFRDFAERHCYPLELAAPILNADGEISPVSAALPPDGVTLVDLDDDNCGPDGAGWSHGSDDAINLVRVKYMREYRMQPHVAGTGRAESDKILEREVIIERKIDDSVDLLGEQVLEVSPLLLRAVGTIDGGPLGGDLVNEVGHQVAQRVMHLAADRYALGGQYFRVRGMRTNADVEGLGAGSWVTASFSWMPDYLLGTRGLARLGQVVGRRNIDAAWCLLTLIDAGSDNAPVSAPTLGTLTSDAAGVVTIPVDALGSGAEARVDYAINGTEPAAGSGLWTFLARAAATGDVTTPPVPAGVTVWIRARGEQLGRRPSAWTTADDITVAETARASDVRLVVDPDTGAVTVFWTPNAFCEGVEINYDVHARDAVPGAGTDVELDADDLSYAVPLIPMVTTVLTVTLTPYDGWSGSAVSGTAGLPVTLNVSGILGARLDSSERAHPGSTGGPVSLQTFQVPPLFQNGKDCAVRVKAVVSTTGSGDIKQVTISYDDLSISGALSIPTGAQSLTVEIVISSFATTLLGVVLRPVLVSSRFAQSPVDTDEPQDIDVYVELFDGGDTATLELSEIEWLGVVD